MARRKKKDNKYYIYTALIAILFIASNYIVKYSFELNGTSIYYSVLTIPFFYLFSCLVYKRYGFKKTMSAVMTAITLQLMVFLGEYLITSTIDMGVLVGTISSALITEFIIIGLYKLINSKHKSFISIFIILSVAVILDNLLFLYILSLFNNNEFIINMINISNLIKVIIAFISSFIFIKIK